MIQRLGSRRISTVLLGLGMLLLSACGYHTSGHAVRLPSDIHTIYVPMFGSTVQEFRVEQVMTAAVVEELHSRSNFRVTTSPNESADATLKGTVTYATTIPQTYDTQTGKVSSYLLVVSMKVSLVSSSGRTVWENPNYTYRDQYQLSQDPASFFEESTPAVQRVARDFSRSLVSNILEAY